MARAAPALCSEKTLNWPFCQQLLLYEGPAHPKELLGKNRRKKRLLLLRQPLGPQRKHKDKWKSSFNACLIQFEFLTSLGDATAPPPFLPPDSQPRVLFLKHSLYFLGWLSSWEQWTATALSIHEWPGQCLSASDSWRGLSVEWGASHNGAHLLYSGKHLIRGLHFLFRPVPAAVVSESFAL